MQDFRLMPQCIWGLRCAVKLRSINECFFTNVLGQRGGRIFKVQNAQKFHILTLEDGKYKLPRNVGNKMPTDAEQQNRRVKAYTANTTTTTTTNITTNTAAVAATFIQLVSTERRSVRNKIRKSIQLKFHMTSAVYSLLHGSELGLLQRRDTAIYKLQK